MRDGEKGPLVVDAVTVQVQAKQEGRVGTEERQVVIRMVGESRVEYALTNAGPEDPLAAANGEAGLDHDEVRSWVGWRHHMTLSLVAPWFLCLERRRVGGENPGDDGAAGAAHPGPAAPRPTTQSGGDRGGGQPRAAA